MAVIQMTRAEYEKKYGKTPVAPASTPAVDTTPSITRMTRTEYEAKYGLSPEAELGTGNTLLDKNPVLKKMGTNANNGINPLSFGNPLDTVKNAGADVNAAITGTGAYEGKGAVERGFNASASAAMAIPAVAADLIPGGKAVLDIVGQGFDKATKFAGGIGGTLADIAEKVGIMTPEQRKQYDKNNAAFADSPVGVAIESAASIGKSSGDIASVILGAHATATAAQNFLDNKVPVIKQDIQDANAKYKADQQTHLVSEQANEIAAIENRYAKGRKANLYSKDEGAVSRQRIAQSNVLKYSINEDGLIQTSQRGGAVDQYKAMTVKPAEGVVRANLVREGGKTNLAEVRRTLQKQVMESGLEGSDLTSALQGIDKEIAGLRVRADQNGYVSNEILHDAKINTTDNINFQTPPETAAYRKAVARAYKELVESNSNFNVKEVNAELAKYYEDIARLQRLDGARVLGGRLGKYTAQISGNIVGGAFGSLFGAPGVAIGSILGGELSGLIKGKSMANTFNKIDGGSVAPNPVLDKAVQQGKSPRLMLPAGGTFRSQIPSGKPIKLRAKSASTLDAQRP